MPGGLGEARTLWNNPRAIQPLAQITHVSVAVVRLADHCGWLRGVDFSDSHAVFQKLLALHSRSVDQVNATLRAHLINDVPLPCQVDLVRTVIVLGSRLEVSLVQLFQTNVVLLYLGPDLLRYHFNLARCDVIRSCRADSGFLRYRSPNDQYLFAFLLCRRPRAQRLDEAERSRRRAALVPVGRIELLFGLLEASDEHQALKLQVPAHLIHHGVCFVGNSGPVCQVVLAALFYVDFLRSTQMVRKLVVGNIAGLLAYMRQNASESRRYELFSRHHVLLFLHFGYHSRNQVQTIVM